MPSNNKLQYTLSLQDLFSGKMAQAINQTEKMDASMSGIGAKIKQLAIGFGAATLGNQILETGVQFDSMQMRLKTLVGSAEGASAIFEQIKKDAATTPFDVGSLTQANSLLISSGVNAADARKDVLNLGNAIAASGGGTEELNRMAVNMQQIKNLGKASALDIKQFAFAGIPIYKLLAASTGKSVAQLKEMDITYEELSKALEKAASKGGMFFGALEDQSKTVGGQISNLKDQFQALLYNLYEKAKPAITFVISGLSKLMTLFLKLLPLIKMGITLWGAYWLKTKLATIQSYHFAVAQRAMAMGMSKTAIATTWVSRGIRGIGTAIKAVPIIGWIAALVEGIQYLWDTFSGFREAVFGFVEGIKQMGDTLILTFKGVYNVIKGAITGNVQQMKEGLILQAQAGALQLSASARGIQKGKDSFAASQGLGGDMDLATLGGSAAGGGKGVGGGGSVGGSAAVGITSAKPQNIIINVTKLVEELNINTTNIKEGAAKLREEVAKALLETLNDANNLATA